METVTFSNSSWHFWLASEWGGFYYGRSQMNVCSYIRCVMWGMVRLALGATGVTLLACSLGNVLGVWAAVLMGTINELPFVDIGAWAGVSTLLICVFTGFAALVFGAIGVSNFIDYLVHRQPKKVRQPNFIAVAYQSFKDKTCRRVSFK